jgi:hypothetical protein
MHFWCMQAYAGVVVTVERDYHYQLPAAAGRAMPRLFEVKPESPTRINGIYIPCYCSCCMSLLLLILRRLRLRCACADDLCFYGL